MTSSHDDATRREDTTVVRRSDAPPPDPDGPGVIFKDDANDPHLGTTLHDKYQVEARIGDPGGMGNVYMARNLAANTRVAVKILKPELQNDESLSVRFAAEGRLGISHPHVVKILEVQNQSVPSYIVMELLQGQSLAEYIRSGRTFTEGEVIDVFTQVLEALAHLHGGEKPILHRDIKPSNIMLDEPTPGRFVVHLIDFGIAKRMAATDPDSPTGTLINPTPICTPQYAPPEQFVSMASVNEQSDLYSVGVSLYEMLTGKMPYDFEHDPAVASVESRRDRYFHAHQAGRFPAPGRHRRGLSRDWRRIFNRALSPEKRQRYASCEAFLADLRGIELRRSNRLRTVVAVAVFLLAVAALFWPWTGGPHPASVQGLVAVDGPSGFYVDAEPVSVAEYAAFLDVTGHAPPEGWAGASSTGPVTGVSWGDAVAYAGWKGLRLPTADELARAAEARVIDHMPGGAEWTHTSGEAPGFRSVYGHVPTAPGRTVTDIASSARAQWLGFRCAASPRPPRLIERLVGRF